MTQTAAFWDGIADGYAKSPIRDVEAYEYALGRTRSYLTASDRVLELGCGTGSTALLLSDSVGSIMASDLSPKMVEIGRRKAAEKGAENVEFLVADVHAAQRTGAPFDAVLALNLLHLLDDLPEALASIHATLRPGGHFISKTVCTSGGRWPLRFRLMKFALPLLQRLGKAPFVTFRTIEELEGEIQAAGFEIVETGNYPVSPPSRYIVARKPE